MYRSIFPDGRAMWSRSIFPDGLLCTYHGRPIFPGNQLYRSHYGWPIYPGGRDQTMSICRQDETPLYFYKFVILGYFIQDSMATKKEYNLVSFCIFVNYYIHNHDTSVQGVEPQNKKCRSMRWHMVLHPASDPPSCLCPKPNEDTS